MSKNSFGKPLKGTGTLGARFTGPIKDGILNALASGGIPLENVSITGGVVDGVTLGSNTPGPGIFTTIQSGNPSGQGYTICFYGQSVGDSACWEPVLGKWNIQGDLLVRDISDFGNLRISGNTLSSTNSNGNIILDPLGSGIINLIGPITQSTINGDITLNTTNGLYELKTGGTITSTSGTDNFIKTNNGDIVLKTGINISIISINNISIGTNPTITTNTPHNFEVGDTVVISGTNSVPNVNGTFNILSIASAYTFTILLSFNITSTGDIGSVFQHNDIFLSATNNVNIPQNTGLTFGSDTQNIKGNALSEITISTGGDINLSPSTGFNINIPDNIGLTFGSDNRKIESDGNNLTLDTGTGDFIINNSKTTINGDLVVNGVTTHIKSNVTTLDDPVITLGGNTVDDNKDRGIEFLWNTGTASKVGFFGFKNDTGCFTVIPDATNTNEVFSGTIGCAKFGDLTASSLNLQGGILNNVGLFNTCNINCSSTMTISANNSINLTSPLVTTSSGLTSNGNFIANGAINTINGTTMDINSTTTNINSTTTNFNGSQIIFNDRILTIGVPVSDYKDRGIEFRYNDKLGFFGWDDSVGCFTFLTDTTNTDDVISGTLGNVCFDMGNFSSLNVCNINCSGNMTITASNDITINTGNTGTMMINSKNVSIDDPIVTIGNTANVNQDRGIEFKYNNGGSKSAFIGWDNSADCFTFLQDTTNVSEVISGTLGNACFGNTTVNNLTVNGTINAPSLSLVLTKEHLNSNGGGVINPTSDINITFITILTAGIVTGTLPTTVEDGFQKHIMISSMVAGAKYQLSVPNGRMVDPGTGSSVSKTLNFEYTGQSVFLIWDNNAAHYIPVNGGVCIS